MADRQFDTGATRDQALHKLDYEGFMHPLVLRRFAEYMHANRKRPDGSWRTSDNWQLGIPRDDYMKSLFRHVMDMWLHHRSCGRIAREPLENAICGVMFNAMGYLLEVLREPDSKPGTPEDGAQHAKQNEMENHRFDDGIPMTELRDTPLSWYQIFGKTTIVNRDNVPLEYREHLPNLDKELNFKEWSDLAPCYKPLYYWNEASSRFLLLEQYLLNWTKSLT